MGTKCKHDISSVTSQVTEECESNHIQTVFEASTVVFEKCPLEHGSEILFYACPHYGCMISLNEWIFKLYSILHVYSLHPHKGRNRYQNVLHDTDDHEGFNFKAIFFQAD